MYEQTRSDNKLNIRLPATLEHIDRADEDASAFLKERNVAVDAFAVRILLRESLLNAVTHGSGKDPAKAVTFTLEIDDLGILMVIEDEGPGFCVPDTPGEFDILGDGGRGLPIMYMYASEVSFNEKGNQVALRRNVNHVSAETSCKGADQ